MALLAEICKFSQQLAVGRPLFTCIAMFRLFKCILLFLVRVQSTQTTSEKFLNIIFYSYVSNNVYSLIVKRNMSGKWLL